MKKLTMLVVLLAMSLMLAACGSHKNELDIGYDLAKKGDCSGADPYLTDTIANPDDIMDLALAYFLKGKCAEKAGDAAMAYENYYAAKIVSCYAVANDTHVNMNTYGRSEYCQKIIPEMLEKLAPDAGDVEAITNKVDQALHARYLERFAKGN
ncbi:MAG: hypothetical protein OCC46_15130 [Pseudodesulfovibrio sp.]